MVNPALNCYGVSQKLPFAATLAKWVLERHGQAPESLPRLLVLLPNRRACRSLREAFLECSGGRPLLLPRIHPIGDFAESSEILFAGAPSVADIPPAIAPQRRQLLLTKLVMRYGHAQAGRLYNAEQAAQMASQLASFMDEAALFGLSFDRLESLVPEKLARHWQQTVDFLNIVSRYWPGILEAEGCIDAVDRRNRLLKALARTWKETPPDYPVIAAGSTGSQPATAALLATVARMPQGMLVLHGLDTGMAEEEWRTLGETHPQYGLKQLLATLECNPDDVRALAETAGKQAMCSDARVEMLRAMFQPAQATAAWPQAAFDPAGLGAFRVAVAATQMEEARMIGIALRAAIEQPGKTAALVTPDRALARMVAAQMQRYGIAVDDSAGVPLLDTPPGCFLRMVADVAETNAAPAPLLALLRHPLAAVGLEPAECRLLSRTLELQLLRGIRMSGGLDAMAQEAREPALKALLEKLREAFAPLFALYRKSAVSLADMLAAQLQCAEALAASAQESGQERLWAGDAGNQLAAKLADIHAHASVLDEIEPWHYRGLLRSLLAGDVLRPRYGRHPRIAILSPMEARLQHFDSIILGGMNEGVWPALPTASPWMSRPMQADFGLPDAERSIGQSAHDVQMLCAMPDVLITRSKKTEGSPAIASRWFVRLKTLMKGRYPKQWEAMQATSPYAYGVSQLDRSAPMEMLRAPAPKPPLDVRPRKLSVTKIETHLRDPYMIYALHILNLKPLKPLDEDPGAADFGHIVHGALEQYATRCASGETGGYAALLECGRVAFAEYISRPAIASLWWPRFEAMASWFVEEDARRRHRIAELHVELQGKWEMEVGGSPFALTTRIDRIEVHKDGGMVIADYKTGSVPDKKDITQGLSAQLALEALVAMHGEVAGLSRRPAADVALEYWKLSGTEEKCEVKPVTVSLEAVHAQLQELLRKFLVEGAAYAAQENPRLLPRYNDYAHLTRRQEWEAA